MDGVLLLSSDLHYNAFCKALLDEPVEILDYSEFAGMRTDSAIRKIYKQAKVVLNPEKFEEIVSRKRKYAAEMLREHLPVAPDCYQVIAELFRRDISLAIASSSSSQNVQLFLDSSGTRNFFSIIMSGEDVENAKPNPEIFRTVRNSLRLLPESCFVVEDSESGIRGAQADGMKVIGVVGQHTQKELLLFGTLATISRLNELLELNVFQDDT
jgi:beta-phosphoglucomutase